jgi:hypothetical protein
LWRVLEESSEPDSVAQVTARLDVGTVLQRVFEIYKDQFGLLVPAALVVFVPVAVINGVILNSDFFLAGLITAGVALIGTYWFQGMVVEAARDILDGRRDHDIGSLFRAASPFIGKLIGAGLLAGIAITIGLLLLIAPGLYLLTIWAVIVPAIVLERVGVFDSFGRSRQLVKGYGWPVLGVLVCLFVVQVVLSLVLNAIIYGIVSNLVGYLIGDLISRTLIAPLSALAAAVLYFELKRLHSEPVPGQEAFTAPQAQPATAPQPGPPAPPPAASP